MNPIDDAMLDAKVTFRVRPLPVSCMLRPTYRISLLVLLFDQCTRQQATMLQIQVLNWAIRNPTNRQRFLQFMAEDLRPDDVLVRFDPTLSRAIDFAMGEGVVEVPTGNDDSDNVPHRVSMHLGENGKSLLTSIKQMSDVFVIEKNFLASIGRKVSRKAVEALFHKE